MHDFCIRENCDKFKKKSPNCQLKFFSSGFIKLVPDLMSRMYKNCFYEKCEKNEYRCKSFHYCIPLHAICDGIFHCPLEDDESNCGL